MRMIALAALIALAGCTQAPETELAGRWQVQQIAGASLGEGVNIWIEFDRSGERVQGYTGCNNFTTTAAVFGTGVSFAPVTEDAGTCPSMAAATDEERFLRVLPGVQRFIRHGRSLELLEAPNGSEALIRLRLEDQSGG